MRNGIVKSILIVLILSSLSLILIACWDTGDLIEKTFILEMGEAQKVHAGIMIYEGNLEISGGNQQSLLISDFTYNLKQWAPTISYSEENNEGDLKIIQKEDNEKQKSDYLQNKWLLQFNKDIPLKLDIVMGRGENHLRLDLINLTGLKAIVGTGDTVLDLTGDYQENISVFLVGGFGNTTINLPENVGIRLIIEGMLNRINCDDFKRINNFYYNSSFDFSERKIYITLISGLGNININLI